MDIFIALVKPLRHLLLLVWLCMSLSAWAGQLTFDVSRSDGAGDWLPYATMVSQATPKDEGPATAPAENAAWTPPQAGRRAIGFDYRGIWTRTVLSNPGDSPRLGWLVVADAYMDYVDCFLTSDDGNLRMVYRMGDKRPFAQRPVAYPRVILPVNVFPHGAVRVDCLVRNNGSASAIFQYWSPERYATYERQQTFTRAICYGALGFTIFMALILSLINGGPLALFFVVDLLPALVASSTREGDTYQLLWPTHPELNWPPYWWILIGVITASLVFRAVVQLCTWEDRLVRVVMWSCGGLLLWANLVPAHGPSVSLVVQGVAVLYPLMLILMCARHWEEGPVARLLCVGMGVQFLALVVNAAGVMGLVQGEYGGAILYACVIKAVTLAAALFYRMRIDRHERARVQAEHTMELERRLRYEGQLRHVVSHHPRYGMPNQAFLEESVRTLAAQSQDSLSVWIVKLNRFGFLESILPPDTLSGVVKIYADELQQWFAHSPHVRLMPLEGSHKLAALDDSTLAFVSHGEPTDIVMNELESFLTRRFEWQGLFVAWDPRIGVSTVNRAQLSDGGSVIDEARIALQWSSAHMRVVRFDAERMKREQLAYGLTLDLEGAIDRGELLLHYQPKISLATRKTDSLEALVRWLHPERGMIPPNAFIAEAEATGAINRLTMWAISEAAKFLVTLPDENVRVSVNITAFDLATPRFVDKVLEALAKEHCPPSRLVLEVTESAALSDRERATEILANLRAAGVKIALDDFGTGYSSLGILQELPLDELKVDRSFVTDIAEFGRKQAVLQAMIEVGHRLGLTVTIEGVEHESSVNWLATHGCDVVQGFFFSRPLDANAARRWLGCAEQDTSQQAVPV